MREQEIVINNMKKIYSLKKNHKCLYCGDKITAHQEYYCSEQCKIKDREARKKERELNYIKNPQ